MTRVVVDFVELSLVTVAWAKSKKLVANMKEAIIGKTSIKGNNHQDQDEKTHLLHTTRLN